MTTEHENTDDRLEQLQETVHDVLRETSFGKPVSLTTGGKTIVYRRRQYEGASDSGAFELERVGPKKAKVKRSQAQVEAWNKMNAPRAKRLGEAISEARLKLTGSSKDYEGSLLENFPLAYELVEYVQGGGSIDNVSRIMQLKPPEIHGIEDIADSIDWHLLNSGINSEHIETALSKDGNSIILFMDDRAQPRLPQIKEILSKFGEPRILQKADDVNENTSQPHGFYIFDLNPDTSLYQPREKEEPEAGAWDGDAPQPEMTDSQEDVEDEVMVDLSESFEPFCSTCGERLFEQGEQRHAFMPSSKLSDKKWEQKQKVQAKAKAAWKKTAFTAEDIRDISDIEAEISEMCGASHGKKKKKKIGESSSKDKEMDKNGNGKSEKNGKNDPSKDDDYEDSDDPMEKNKSSEAFDARVGDPKGKKKKDHPSTVDDSLEQDAEGELDEKWAEKVEIRKTGEHAPKSVGQLKKEMASLQGSKPFPRGKYSELMFAVRSKTGWKKGPGATGASVTKMPEKKPQRLAASLECPSCGSSAVTLDEHEFKGYYCARHGARLDKYSRACNECKEDERLIDSIVVVCPECTTETTMEANDCGVCGANFVEDSVVSYAEYLADTLIKDAKDDDILEKEQDWSESYAEELGKTLFADVEEDTDSPF